MSARAADAILDAIIDERWHASTIKLAHYASEEHGSIDLSETWEAIYDGLDDLAVLMGGGEVNSSEGELVDKLRETVCMEIEVRMKEFGRTIELGRRERRQRAVA